MCWKPPADLAKMLLLIYKVQGEGIYYDSILDRLYANEEIYYRELESMEKE